MEKFRLAIFNTQPPHLYFGGVERRIIETAKRLQNQADITVYSGTKAGFKTPVNIEGVRFVPCYSTDRLFPLDNWFFNRSLTRTAEAFNADVYEAHAVSGYGFPGALKKKGQRKPFIHTIHGVLADEYEQAKANGYASARGKLANQFMGRLARLEEKMAHQADLIVTISKYSLEKIQSHYGVDAGKIRIAPNGVDPERFKPADDAAVVKQQFGLGEEPCVLFVGSLIPRKGLGYLVEAAKIVAKEKAGTRFLIVGEGPLRKQMSESLNAANLEGTFKFLGKIRDDALPLLYQCADVFVLPSIQEGQGIVLLEAQATGKPVVAFDVGGVNEAVRNGETGLLVERGNSERMAEALLNLLDNRGLRENMGLRGRLLVSENFTWDICASKMLNIYREALAY